MITAVFCVVAVLFAVSAALGAAQQAPKAPGPPPGVAAVPAATLPAGYVIGPEDVLAIVFWRDRDLSVDSVVVRPDGKVSLPLLNDVQAAGLTPEQLGLQLMQAASKFVQDPNATVVVREIKSRNVFITGNVTRPGTYPLGGGINVVQLIAVAGGLLEYADAKHIVVMRSEQGRQQTFKVNYKDIIKQKNLRQNIVLKPGDTVVVP